jgi:PAS domain S-box-containing protein
MPSPTFLDGGGQMGALMRAMDWSRTPLGPTETWPQSLRTTVSTCLNSRFPILIWWGPQHVKLYNDAYRDIIAAKHPRALGAPGREVWPEIWNVIGPMLDSVVREGRATWSEDQFLPLERHGFAEETYFTFSYSPIRDESGGIGGVFSAVSETTERVIGARRLQLLQTLATDGAADTSADACRRAVDVLSRDPADVLFAMVYLLDADGRTLRRAAATDTPAVAALAPDVVDVGIDAAGPWPFRRVLESRSMLVAEAAVAQTTRAFVAPISAAAQGSAIGVLVAGVNPMLPVNEQYRGFAGLIARELGGSLARARAFEDERRRVESLAELDRLKTTFFSNVSHEFRTPLTLMLSPVEDALASSSRSLGGSDLLTVHRNALRLLKLVNTLLDFALIEAGRARAAFEPTNAGELTSDLASTFRSAVMRAGLQYEVDCAALSRPIAIDRDAWEKIVLNLLSNALKFTFEGRISLSLHDRDDHVELQVTDTGVGIPQHEIPRLFDRFHRVRGVRARTHEGSGIGLALVNELVKMHGGTLSVVSQVGQGTTFTVSIPARALDVMRGFDRGRGTEPSSIQQRQTSGHLSATAFVSEALRWLPSEPGDAAVAHEPTDAEATHARILLADDNADMREYVARLLSDRWTVESVPNGAAALQAVRRRKPSLVISDVMMPVLDGFELLRALRTDSETRDLPVILLSARAGEEASIEGLAAGADDYLVKPFSARELRARVEAQLLRAEIRAVQAANDRRLADMFRHAPVAISMLRGPDFVFEFANDAYLAVIGHRDVVGKTLAEALPELTAQGFNALLDRVRESGEPYVADSRRVVINRGPHGDAEGAYFNLVCQPVRDHDGRVERIAVIAVDVTELVQARHQAEAANRAKDHFLAVLGHELRTPLAPILAATRLLEVKGPSDPTIDKLRQTIFRQTTHLSKLVDDLLDVGRIITGKLRLDRTRVDLATIVRQACEASSPLIVRRRHTLDVSLPDTPVQVEGDGGRMTQVLCNLLNNAAKYMDDEGRIELSVSEDAGQAVIRVRDEGIGIAPDMLDRIFDRFVQDGAPDVVHDGLGIGLSIVKTIVEMHGGTVVVHSHGPGRGSEFTVALPVAAPVAGADRILPNAPIGT